MTTQMTKSEAIYHLSELLGRHGVNEVEVAALTMGIKHLLKRRADWCRNRARKAEAARLGAGDRLEVLAARLEGGLETREGDHRTEAAVIAPPMEAVTDPWEGGVGGDGTSGTDETHRTEGTGETGGTGDGEVVA